MNHYAVDSVALKTTWTRNFKNTSHSLTTFEIKPLPAGCAWRKGTDKAVKCRKSLLERNIGPRLAFFVILTAR